MSGGERVCVYAFVCVQGRVSVCACNHPFDPFLADLNRRIQNAVRALTFIFSGHSSRHARLLYVHRVEPLLQADRLREATHFEIHECQAVW